MQGSTFASDATSLPEYGNNGWQSGQSSTDALSVNDHTAESELSEYELKKQQTQFGDPNITTMMLSEQEERSFDDWLLLGSQYSYEARREFSGGGYMMFNLWRGSAITKIYNRERALATSKTATNIAEDVATGGSTYTKSSLKLGQEIHKAYKSADVLKNIRIKEFRLPSGKRIDFIDFEKKIIYELKPNNPRQINAGHKQLDRYLQEVESIYGPGWKTVLDVY